MRAEGGRRPGEVELRLLSGRESRRRAGGARGLGLVVEQDVEGGEGLVADVAHRDRHGGGLADQHPGWSVEALDRGVGERPGSAAVVDRHAEAIEHQVDPADDGVGLAASEEQAYRVVEAVVADDERARVAAVAEHPGRVGHRDLVDEASDEVAEGVVTDVDSHPDGADCPHRVAGRAAVLADVRLEEVAERLVPDHGGVAVGGVELGVGHAVAGR